MFSVLLSIPIFEETDFDSVEWKIIERELIEVTGEDISDTGRGMFSCDESDGSNLSRDFWFDNLDWEKTQEIKQFCQQKGYGIKIREAVTTYPAHSMECPKCGCEQMIEDGEPAMPCVTLPELVTCQECKSVFHPVKWEGRE